MAGEENIYVAAQDTTEGAQTIGGKAAALAALGRADLPIPPWFALRPAAFYDSLKPPQRDALARARTSGRALEILQRIELSPAVRVELTLALEALCPNGEFVAVRSSAADEDSAQHSFAGQLESYLFVPVADVAARVLDVWRSGFSERLYAYRAEHGLDPAPCAPAVLVQRMVNAKTAGVAFGADPVTGRRDIALVAGVFGLGTSLVSGESDADTYRVDESGQLVEREIAEKRIAHRPALGSPEGIRTVHLDDAKARASTLEDERVREIAELARRAGRHFGRPQDVEWAVDNDRLYLLQSRPITTLGSVADPAGALNLWDNSNIAESYGGVTTPLTFSFARRAYEEVYRQFCRLMRVPDETIDANADTFRRMLGLVRGRVYYNLLSWYRVLATLPGFSFNRRFMEQMMGVKEGVPDEVLAGIAREGRLRDAVRMAGTVGGLAGNYFVLSRRIREFYARLENAIGEATPKLDGMRADELVAHYRDLERRLLTRWDAPLVNDFFAMIFYGVLRKLAASWCGDEHGTLQNDLISGEGGIVSAEPVARMRKMARLASPHPTLVAALREGGVEEIAREAAAAPEFRREYESYLDKFGDRCMDELKLESPTLHDDPLVLLRAVGHLAARHDADAPTPAAGTDTRARAAAEGRVAAVLSKHALRRAIFGWVLRNARARVRERENLRFERTRLFGRVRRIFVELGRRLYEVDALDDARDVFYLEVEEALGYVTGTCTTANLKGLVAVRRAEFEEYRRTRPPDDRFETRGIVHRGNRFLGAPAAAVELDGDERKGLGCCPGVVRGPARVVTDPKTAEMRPGEILVAERTDPGWVMLFASASGLLVERGSLLSHSAIVSREMGIPAIVSVPGVTTWLETGDLVELDGTSGVVRKVSREQARTHTEST